MENCYPGRVSRSDPISKSKVFGKDSFERFGDDLCEDILSYLSIEDKFRFESVSKQFQRLVFNKQTELRVKHRFYSKFFSKGYLLNTKNLTLVLKKCPNITSICFPIYFNNGEEVFSLIIKNCKHLNELNFTCDLRDEHLYQFLSIIGSNIKKSEIYMTCPDTLRMSYDDINQMHLSGQTVLRYCPNLVKLTCDGIMFRHINGTLGGNDSFPNSLETISSIDYIREDFDDFTKTMETFKQNLKSLKLTIKRYSCVEEKHSKDLFNELIKLTKIKSLDIWYDFSLDDIFLNYIKQLAKNCPKMKRLAISLKIGDLNKYQELYKILNQFEELNHLSIVSNDSETKISLDTPLPNFRNLTQLTILGNIALSDHFFTSIDKNLPKLQRISFKSTQVSEKTFQPLSKLLKLKEIEIFSKSNEIQLTETLLFDIIEKCQNLMRFWFNSEIFVIRLFGEKLENMRSGKPFRGVECTDKNYLEHFPRLKNLMKTE